LGVEGCGWRVAGGGLRVEGCELRVELTRGLALLHTINCLRPSGESRDLDTGWSHIRVRTTSRHTES